MRRETAAEEAVAAARQDTTKAGQPAPVLALSKLSKDYYPRGSDTCVSALRNVTLNVWPGQFVSIVGRSGCGKSTLLRIIAGLTGWDSGSVLLAG